MAKSKTSFSSKNRTNDIEIQRGPISMDKKYSMSFTREPERTFEDMQNLELRRSGMTLTKHEPKR